jgi:hypothetical protein
MKQDLELLLKRTAFKEDYTIGTLGYTDTQRQHGKRHAGVHSCWTKRQGWLGE